MDTMHAKSPAARAILTIAEVKATLEAFDRGDLNLFVAIDAIAMAVEAFKVFATSGRDAA